MMRVAVCDDNADFLLSEITMIEKWSEQSEIDVYKRQSYGNDRLMRENNRTLGHRPDIAGKFKVL